MLKGAILTEAQAVSADFARACLTGATIEAWNIDKAQYVKIDRRLGLLLCIETVRRCLSNSVCYTFRLSIYRAE